MLDQVRDTGYASLIDNGASRPLTETLAEYMIATLEQTRDVIGSYLVGLEGAERAKVEKVKQQIEDYLEQLRKAKAMSGLAKFFKALGALGVALAMITAILIPTPMTIAILAVTLVMFLEPLISEAAGSESFIEKGMGAMFEALSDALGPIGAIVVGTLLMIAIVVVCTALMAGGLSAMSSSVSAGVQAAREFASSLPAYIAKMLTGSLTEAQTIALTRFLEYAQSAILMAQAGLQAEMGQLQYEGAKLLKEAEVAQAIIDGWSQIIEMLSQENSNYQDLLQRFQMLIAQLFGV